MSNKICGVYKIEDVESGDIYIGYSNDVKRRLSTHNANIKGGKHDYQEFNEAYKDNPDRVKFEILEICNEDEVAERETWHIQHWKKIDGCNVLNKNEKTTKKSKVKDTTRMCAAQAGEGNGNCNKLNADDVKEIKKLLKEGKKQSQLAKRYNVSQTLIWNIKEGKRWSSVR